MFGRRVGVVFFAVAWTAIGLGSMASAPAASVPSPANSTCPTVVTVSPNGGNECCFTVVVRDFAGVPIAGSTVEVDFGSCAITFCPNQPAGVVVNPGAKTATVVTNALGQASFCICACITGSCTVNIFADGVFLCQKSAQNCAACPANPACQVSPSPLNFGNVAVGGSADQTLIITNVGGGTLSGTVTENCPDFSLIGTPSYSLGAGQSQLITVRFAPASPGPQACVITTGTSCSPDTAYGTGQNGTPVCQVSPSPLDFGSVNVGSTADRTLTIMNIGGGTLTGTITESCPAFSLIGTLSYSLTAGQSHSITVRFAPASTGLQICLINTGNSCPPDSAIGTGTTVSSCTVVASGDTVCLGGSIHLFASGTPAGGTYSWTGPNGFTSALQNPVITNAQPSRSGTYTVHYINGRCTPQASVQVLVDSLGCSIFDPDSVSTACGSTGNHLCVSATGAVNYAWSLAFADPGWSITGGQGTNCITYAAGPSGMAQFKVVLTSASGCRDSCYFADSCAAPPCSVSVSGDREACGGGTIHLSATGSPPGGYYVWNGPNGFSSTQQDPVVTNVSGASAGTYEVTYYAAPCTTSTTIDVAVDTLGCPIYDADSLATTCGSTGNRLCVGAPGAATYAWSIVAGAPGWTITSGQGTSCITYAAGPSGSALFKVLMVSPAGCRDSCFFADTCTASSPCSVAVSATARVCEGGAIQLNAAGSPPGGSYRWTGPNGFTSSEQNPVIAGASAANAGTYQVTYYLGGAPNDPTRPPVLERMWGSWGIGPGQFHYPTDVAVDASGNVYVADGNNRRIQKFTTDGVYVTQWSLDDQLLRSYIANVHGLGVDAAGHVYAASIAGPVLEFTGAGEFLGYCSDIPDRFTDVAVDAAGNIFVVGLYPPARKFSSDCDLLLYFGHLGQVPDPGTLCPLSFGIAVDQAGFVYIADTGCSRIQKFTNMGEYVSLVGGYPGGSAPGQFDHPASVVVDAEGHIYVADSGNDRIQRFASNGGFLSQWGGPGAAAGSFDHPVGVAVDGAGDVYVADSDNSRVQKFTFSAAARCSAQASVSVQVDTLMCAIFDGDSLPTMCGSVGNRLCVVALGAVSYEWSLDSPNHSWAITSGPGTSCVTYSASQRGPARFKVVLTSATGCRDSCFYADSCGRTDAVEALPSRFALYPCSPNPARGRVRVGFDLARSSPVALTIFGVDGRVAARVLEGESRRAGHHEVEFKTAALPPGLYFYRLTAGPFSSSRRLLIVR